MSVTTATVSDVGSLLEMSTWSGCCVLKWALTAEASAGTSSPSMTRRSASRASSSSAGGTVPRENWVKSVPSGQPRRAPSANTSATRASASLPERMISTVGSPLLR